MNIYSNCSTYHRTNAKTKNVFKSLVHTYDLWQTGRNLNIYYVTTYINLYYLNILRVQQNFSFGFRSTTFHILKFRQNCGTVSFLSHIYGIGTTIYIRSLPLSVQYALLCKVKADIYVVDLNFDTFYAFLWCGVWKRHSYIQYAFVGTLRVWKTCVYSKSIFRIEYSVYCCLALAATAACNPYRVYLYCMARKSFSRVTYILKHFSYILCITRDQHATHPLLNSLSLMHVFIILNIIRASCSFRPFRACARNIFNRLTSCI